MFRMQGRPCGAYPRVVDDPVVSLYAYGGTLENLPNGIQVRSSDGLNFRFFNLTGRMSSSAADQGVNQTNFGTCNT